MPGMGMAANKALLLAASTKPMTGMMQRMMRARRDKVADLKKTSDRSTNAE